MRESADRAQKFLNTINGRLGEVLDENAFQTNSNGFEGEVTTNGELDLNDIEIPSHNDSIQEVARDIDSEIMDDVYGAVRNNSSRRHNGYNELRALRAVENGVPPGLMTGADPRTIEQWYDDFREAGLTYGEDGEEQLTTEGEFFIDEVYRFMNKIGGGKDDKQTEEALGNLFGSISKRREDQGDKLYGFMLMAETDKSLPQITEETDIKRRNAYNWADQWMPSEDEDRIALMSGEPSDRQLTPFGHAAYNMIGNHYQRMDAVSQMKAEVITYLDEHGMTGDQYFMPGNRDMVTPYLEDESLADEYMQQEK